MWLLWRRRKHEANGGNGDSARQARVEAERKLREARREWPAVHEAHDQLASWIDAALRGRRA